MIYNRTQLDIEKAKKIRQEKIQNFEVLTSDDIAILEKGFLTYNTINRIEDRQKYLKTTFNSMGYWNNSITNKTWALGDIFNEDDFERILNNENILRNSFYVLTNTPPTPNISFDFKDINAIEKILYDLGIMITNIKSNYRQCGAFECGGT